MEKHHLKDPKANRQVNRDEQATDRDSSSLFPLASTFLIGLVVGGLALVAIAD